MENNLNKWFDAARHNPPMISSQEVGAMISNPRAAKSGLSTLKKTMFMGTILFTIFGLLYWMNDTPTIDTIQNETQGKSETYTTAKAIPKQDKLNNFYGVAPSKNAVMNNQQELHDHNEITNELFYPVPANSIHYKTNTSAFIYLTEDELARLGILSNGQSFRYNTINGDSDSLLLSAEVKLRDDALVLSYSHKYWPKRDCNGRVMVKPHPAIISDDGSWCWLIAEKDNIKCNYTGMFFNKVKHLLVPIAVPVETNTKKELLSSTYIFWYKPTDDFFELLPRNIARELKEKYGTFDSATYNRQLEDIVREVQQIAAKTEYSPAELNRIQLRALNLSQKELAKLGFHQSNTRNIYTNYYRTKDKVVKQVGIMEMEHKLYFTAPYLPPHKYKMWFSNDLIPLYISDSTVSTIQSYNFQTTTVKQSDDIIKQQLLLKKGMDTLIPVRYVLSDHKTVYYLWFARTNTFLKALHPATVSKLNETDFADNKPKGNYPIPGVNHYQYGSTNTSSDILLNNAELAGLGIITNGNTLRYLTQSDTTVYHFDYKRKPTVFAFSIKVTESGGVSSNNIHEQDDELKKLSNSAVPVVVSINKVGGDDKENSARFLIAEQNTIPFGYRTEYISRVKEDLVPIVVVTKGNVLEDAQDNEIIFWYKNNDQFWQRLPDWARLKAQTGYPVFNEEKHRKLINELKEKDKQAEATSRITTTEIEQSRSRTIDLTTVELQKLNMQFNGKKLTYQLMSKRPDSSFVIIDLLVTPDMFSLNLRDKSGTPVQYKWNENYAWYITDTDLAITQNFVDPIVSDAQEDQRAKDMERLFKARLPEMVPVRVRFDAKAVKKAKYKHPQTVLLFWFPETEAFVKLLPERIQKQLGVNISSLNHAHATPLKYIELTDEQLDKLGIKRNPESITVPMHTGEGKYLLSDYSSKGTVFHFNSVAPINGALKKPSESIKFKVGPGGSATIAPVELKPLKLAFPSPSLITEGNGLHWLTYQTDDEMSKEDQEYMIQHGLSPLEYKPMIEARKRGEEKLAAALNTYIALKVKSNEKPSGESGRNPDLIIWYKPDSLFFAALPNELSLQIQQELANLSRKKSESGCQFFEACQSERGSIGECAVYPNPTTGPMQIKIELLEPRKVSVFITDISGKRVKDILSDETREKGVFNPQINLEGLAEGMYLLHVTTNKGEYIVQRVVKKG